MIRVLLADKQCLLHPGIRHTLAAVEDIILLAELAGCTRLQTICQNDSPDVVLFSPNVAERSYLAILNTLRERCPDVKILVLLSGQEDMRPHQLINQGVNGILLKNDPPEHLPEAIRAIAQGEFWFSPSLAPRLLQIKMPPDHNLTPRETAVLHLLSLEYTNQEIARELNVSERTVRGHLETIYQKLNVKSRTGAVVKAIRLQLIPEE